MTAAQEETEKSDNLFLYIDLPKFDFPVIFSEPVSPPLSPLGPRACCDIFSLARKPRLTHHLKAEPQLLCQYPRHRR